MLTDRSDDPLYKRSRYDENHEIGIAFSGERFNYTYLAAEKVFSSILPRPHAQKYQFQSKRLVSQVFDAVNDQSCAYGVIALESSSHGTIHNVYDKLLEHHGNLVIVGELGMLETHNLCAKVSITSDMEISTVIGHPHILECCSDYLDHIDKQRAHIGLQAVQRVASWDSAAGCAQVASMVIDESLPNNVTAAIGSVEAARCHDLKIIKQGIGNDQNAETRYIVIAKTVSSLCMSSSDSISYEDDHSQTSPTKARMIIDPWQLQSCALFPADTITKKASIALALRNSPGSIFKMSSCFALRDMDIIKIESRPAATAIRVSIPQSPSYKASSRAYTHKHWDLVFYVDYEPSDSDETNRALMNNLKEFSLWVRELGTYCSGLQRVDIKPTNWTDVLDIMSIR
jgi:prephenate dehydratase